jgi:hypothetical protein
MSVSSEGLAAGLNHYRLVAKKRKVSLLPDLRPFEQVDIAQPQPIAPQRLAFFNGRRQAELGEPLPCPWGTRQRRTGEQTSTSVSAIRRGSDGLSRMALHHRPAP